MVLTVSGVDTGAALPSKRVLIRVPKKVARLATRRNRLRRLIKEALRMGFCPEAKKCYVFRVIKDPGNIGLVETKEMLDVLISK